MTDQTDVEPAGGIRILLADDDRVGQMVAMRVLQKAGYEVDVVDDGLEAVNALAKKRYDLVLMDGLMPVMDGFEATRLIREGAHGVLDPRLPIIALTALTEPGDSDRCRAAGMDAHVGKPVHPGRLLSAIEYCLARAAGARPEAAQQAPPPDDFLDSVIDGFMSELPRLIEDLEKALGQSDVRRLAAIGHRLRGSVDLLAAGGLSAGSRALEQAAKAGDTDSACGVARKLIADLQALRLTVQDG